MSRLLPAAFGASCALLSLLWHSADTWLPQDDGANYLGQAVVAWERWTSEGAFASLKAACVQRGWRSTSFPYCALPALAVTGGSLDVSVAWTLSILYGTAGAFAFAFLSLSLPRRRALAGAALILLAPWFSGSASLFFGEIALLAALFASLYHGARCSDWSSGGHAVAFGLWVGFGITLRPVEGLLTLAAPLAWMIETSRRRGDLGPRDLALGLAPAAAVLLLLGLRASGVLGFTRGSFLLMALVLTGSAAAVWACRRRVRWPFAGAALSAAAVSGAWWFPAMESLVEWAHATSFGEMARALDQRRSAIPGVVAGLGGYPLLLLGGLALAGLKRFRFDRGALLTLAGLGLTLALTGLLIWTGTSEGRRLYTGIALLWTGLALRALDPSLPRPRLRTSLAAAGIALLLAATLLNALAPSVSCNPLFIHVFRGLRTPMPGGDPSAEVLSRLEASGLRSSKVAAFTLAMNAPADRVFEPHLLNVLAARTRTGIEFGYVWNFARLEDGHRQIREAGFDSLLLDTKGDFPVELRERDPYARLTCDLIERAAEGRMEELGWRRRDAFGIRGRRVLLFGRQAP